MSQSLTEFVTMPMKREELDTFPVVELEAMTEVDKHTGIPSHPNMTITLNVR